MKNVRHCMLVCYLKLLMSTNEKPMQLSHGNLFSFFHRKCCYRRSKLHFNYSGCSSYSSCSGCSSCSAPVAPAALATLVAPAALAAPVAPSAVSDSTSICATYDGLDVKCTH
jgi:hypothetical protein